MREYEGIPKALEEEEIEKMRKAGKICSSLLREIRSLIKPGVSTQELDEFADRFIEERGARSAFKNYRGFPKTICPQSMKK